jgi:hypothetical protein
MSIHSYIYIYIYIRTYIYVCTKCMSIYISNISALLVPKFQQHTDVSKQKNEKTWWVHMHAQPHLFFFFFFPPPLSRPTSAHSPLAAVFFSSEVIYIYIYIYTHTYIYTYTYTYMHRYIHRYIDRYTYIHAYIHTCVVN